jgi:hypothetical protein
VEQTSSHLTVGTGGWLRWRVRYPAPPDFIEPLLTCAFAPRQPGNANTAEFRDPQVDVQRGRRTQEPTIVRDRRIVSRAADHRRRWR